MPTVTFEDLIYIHDWIIENTGGLKGILDEGVLHSALARPYQTAGGKQIHDDLYKKAAALLDAIANNHGFVDGNKRTAMAVASFFLFTHNIRIKFTNEDYETFMVHVVTTKPPIKDIKSWLMLKSESIV